MQLYEIIVRYSYWFRAQLCVIVKVCVHVYDKTNISLSVIDKIEFDGRTGECVLF